jgi:hypothetical protein
LLLLLLLLLLLQPKWGSNEPLEGPAVTRSAGEAETRGKPSALQACQTSAVFPVPLHP